MDICKKILGTRYDKVNGVVYGKPTEIDFELSYDAGMFSNLYIRSFNTSIEVYGGDVAELFEKIKEDEKKTEKWVRLSDVQKALGRSAIKIPARTKLKRMEVEDILYSIYAGISEGITELETKEIEVTK